MSAASPRYAAACSMGPPFETAEGEAEREVFRHMAQLQWGRRSKTAEGPRALAASRLGRRRFNGAAVRNGGGGSPR